MLSYILRRLASTVLVMGLVGVFVFLLLHLSGGDPAAIIAGDNAAQDQIDGIRKKLGLDDALPVQFWRWALAVLHGDLGVSDFLQHARHRIDRSAAGADPVAGAADHGLCRNAGRERGCAGGLAFGSLIDRALMGFSVLGFSVPVFVVGYVLIYIFSIQLRWLPVQGYKPFREGVWPWLQNLILPSVTLGMAYVALIARITRTSMLDVLAEDYIRTAKAKGVATRAMLIKHALKNAGVPIITVIGIGVALLIGGVVIPKQCSTFPGLAGWW